ATITACLTPTSERRRKTMAAPEAGPRALGGRGLVVGYGGGGGFCGGGGGGVAGGGTPGGGGRGGREGRPPPSLRRRRRRPGLGEVTLDGERLTGKTPREILKAGVVQVPQNHSLFREMTVRENISLGGYILSERGLAERRFAGVLEMFPQVTNWLDNKAGSLS